MQTTPNLGLKKPESNEYIKITDLNDNADIIDESMNTKVTASGGAISETLVDTLETIETKFPIPSAGEKVKTFFGKILTFLRNIKPLESDAAYYVSTTGSDITGDGTQEKPFKTPQKAVDMLPKDLNGYTVKIILSEGVYDSIEVSAFISGLLRIQSTTPEAINSNTKIGFINITHCDAKIEVMGLKFTNNNREYGSVSAIDCRHVFLTKLSITDTSSNPGIFVAETSLVRIFSCDITGRSYAVRFNNTKGYISSCTGASNTIGLMSSSASIMHVIGTVPGATTPRAQENGGTFIEANGTQISNIISSGLSCTWGTLQGAYIRHGNINGTAMVTIQIGVAINTKISAGVEYTISGFPKAAFNSAVSFSPQGIMDNCYIDIWGIIRVRFKQDLTIPYGMLLNCTYLTYE